MSRLRWLGGTWLSFLFVLAVYAHSTEVVVQPAPVALMETATGMATETAVPLQLSITGNQRLHTPSPFHPAMSPSHTPSPVHLFTPSPFPSPTPFPTLTATPTATQTATPTGTATFTSTPAPTEVCRPAGDNVAAFSVPPGPWLRPPAQNSAIGRGPSGNNFISLTFDVEGDGELVGQLLDVLDRHHVKATFFIVGSWAEANGRWVTEIAQRGHELGNHTYSHANLRELSAEAVQLELNQTEAIVQSLTGQSTKPWMRPPYGAYAEETVQTAYATGWSTIIWTGTGVDTDPNATETTICNNLMRSAIPGAILLVHPSKAVVIPAVDRFLTEMIARGYAFVPLSLLFND